MLYVNIMKNLFQGRINKTVHEFQIWYYRYVDDKSKRPFVEIFCPTHVQFETISIKTFKITYITTTQPLRHFSYNRRKCD